MKYKKIIIISVIVLAVSFIMMALSNSTFALFSSDKYAENHDKYSTGLLQIEIDSKVDNISLTNALPMEDSDGILTDPYVFTIRNVGNLDYKFDVKLLSVGDSNVFSSQYIKLQVDDGEVISFNSLVNGVIKDDIILKVGESIDVSLRMWLSIDTPNTELGKSFSSTIVTDGQAIYTETNYGANTLADYITELYLDNKDNIVTNNDIEYQYATSVNLMNDRLGGTTSNYDDGNIRYYGANPNNYIYFNCDDYNNQSDSTCEKWRIIGIVDGKVKIIRDLSEKLYKMDYNNGSSLEVDNNWHDSTLMTFLNDGYYNNKNNVKYSFYNYDIGKNEFETINFETDNKGIKNKKTREMISESIWYLGGHNSSKIYANDIYKYERGTAKCSSCTYDTKWTGNVGLMYTSDYGYAVDFSVCNKYLGEYSYMDCISTNWLYYRKSQWLLTPYSKNNSQSWYLRLYGEVLAEADVGVDLKVRVVLYLDSKLGINSVGDGTLDNPYQIKDGYASNKVNIKYNVNGGNVAESTDEGSWSTNSTGTVLLNGKDKITTVKYGSTLDKDGINNYDNSQYMYITNIGYSAVPGAEWKCLSGNCKRETYSQDEVYNATDFCDASSGDCTVELGVNWKQNVVTIKYNVNSGTVTESTTGGQWSTDSMGTVLLNGSILTASIKYGSAIGTNGLSDYNNSGYLNISKTGYSAVSGEEWICLSDNCVGKTYNQYNNNYTSADFCDASNSDCTVELGVNWNGNIVYINYNVNGGSIVNSSNSYGTWTSDNDGKVLLNDTVLATSINADGTLGSSGLTNYNNNSVLKISNTGYSVVSGAEWKCLSGNCKQETYNQATVYSASDFCDATSSSCTVELGVNWRINKVYIKYNVNGGQIATASNNAGTWTKNSSGTVLLNGTAFTSSINYGANIGTNGLTNYNNSTALNISRTGYSAVSGAEWKCYSGNCNQDTYSQAGYANTGYISDHFCDASNSDCTVELGVNWTSNSSSVNANKFACENSRLAVYYVTVCNGNTCTYSKKNGLNSSNSFDLEDTAPTWSINKNSYVDSLDNLSSSCSYSLRYVTASGGSNCRSGASTSASITRTWNKCTALYVYPTTMQYRANSDGELYRWYYSKTYGCYLTGYNLSSSKPSSCSSSGSGSSDSVTITGNCVCEKTSGGSTTLSCANNNLTSYDDCKAYCNRSYVDIISSTCSTS